MPFISGCFVLACMASIGVPGTLNFIAEVMIIVGSWNKYPFQVIVAVVGIVLTLAYLFKMMRGLFYGPMDQKYSHAHDAVAVVDRLPLLIMITVSIGFFFFPMHLYNVVRSGVDPLIAKITRVVPVAAFNRESSHVNRETTSPPGTPGTPLLANNPAPRTPHPLRGLE
jgi:NADH-quinone oxidoreductase subunit M